MRALRPNGIATLPRRGHWLRSLDLRPRLVTWLSIVAIGLLVGCGPTLYTLDISSAERAFEQARTESARTYAPYEFHYAEVHLQMARREAAEASYEDAIRYADVAERYSHRARVIASRKRAAIP